MQPLDFRIITYRLYRLRKLIAVASLIPFPALLAAMAADVSVYLWMMPLWYAIVLAHVIRFPQAWVDLLGLALAIALTLLIAPVGKLIGITALIGYPLSLVVGFALWLYICNRIYAFESTPWPKQDTHFMRKTGLSIDEMRDIFFLRPNAKVGLNICGPANENGVFEVVSTGGGGMPELCSIDGVDHAGLGTEIDQDLQDGVFRYWATVIKSEPTYQETMFIIEPDSDEMTIETTIQTLTETKNGTLYQKQESTSGMGLVSGFGFWLNDVDADFFTATMDHVAGKPARAIRGAAHDTLLITLAQRLTRKRVEQMHEA